MTVKNVRQIELETDNTPKTIRVLKNGGIFIMMAPSPINYLCDFIDVKTKDIIRL